jgi:hypothetical protein
MWAFATSTVNGLGMTSEEFWASTPREMAAHARLLNRGREFTQGLCAALQATLHNAHFRHAKNDPVFTAEMFMPGYEPPAPADSWRKDLQAATRFAMMFDPQRQAQFAQVADVMKERDARAKLAKANGAGLEEIKAIMRGTVN